MSDTDNPTSLNSSQLLNEQLARSLVKNWENTQQQIVSDIDKITRAGWLILSNYGHPQMPVMGTKELIIYAKQMKAELERFASAQQTALDEYKRLTNLTIGFFKGHK